MDTVPTWVKIVDAAAIASVSRRTIYNWLRMGNLHYRRTAGGPIRINSASLWAGYQGECTPWEGISEEAAEKLRKAQRTGIANRQKGFL